MKNSTTLILWLLSYLLISCGGDEEVNVPVLTKIEINVIGSSRVDIGQSITLRANGIDQFENSIDIPDLMWSASNSNANVDQNGMVTGVKTGTVSIIAESGTVSESIELTIWDSTAPRTEIFVSDAGGFATGPWKIMRFDENGQNGELFTDNRISWPQDLVFLNDETVLISNLNSGEINRYNANTGSFIETFATVTGGPTRMKFGPDGLLYVLQWSGNGNILKFNLEGEIVEQWSGNGVVQNIGLDWDASGILYVSSYGMGNNGLIHRFAEDGTHLGTYINNQIAGPTNIWFDDDGFLNVIDYSNGSIKRFQGANFIGDLVTNLNQPEGIAFLDDGNMLIGNGGDGSIKLFDQNFSFINNYITGTASGLLTPNAVVLRKVNQ